MALADSDGTPAAAVTSGPKPDAQPQEPDALPPLRLRDDEPAAPAAAARADAADDGSLVGETNDTRVPWHRFPRGALAGNVLHDLLEWLAEHRFALAGNAGLQAALARRCRRIGWGHRSDDLLVWLQHLCRTPLPPWGVPLSGLQRLLPEMEFWLPSDGLDTTLIDTLCRRHVLPGHERPVLVPRRLRGLLMGFADGVVQHDGRFAVLDYKSNALGETDADYHRDALAQAMLQHRYDVQAALYLLALHRLLRQRGGAAYLPERDLHGAVYFFLRGVAGPVAGCFHLPAPVALIEALDALLPAVGVAPAGAAVGEGA
jgi:exodeoxyribonuclease V beta subunit